MKTKPECLNPHYELLCSEPPQEREALFTSVARSMSAGAVAIEKDFFVCRAIDAIFNGLSQRPKPFFKGGTSLSKGYGLIDRFSEDIDIVLSPRGLGCDDPVDPNLSGERLRRLLSVSTPGALPSRVKDYADCMVVALRKLLPDCTIDRTDTVDRYGATLRIAYHSVLPADAVDSYIKRSVLIELGGRSIREPVVQKDIIPYVQNSLGPPWNLVTTGITLISAERTFWDKVYIADRIGRRFAAGTAPLSTVDRVSRHYYDIVKIYNTPTGSRALRSYEVRESVRKYCEAPAEAVPGSLHIFPPEGARSQIERDYNDGTSRMMFGTPMPFTEVMARLASLNSVVNEISGTIAAE